MGRQTRISKDMQKHAQAEERVFETTCSDGSVVRVNYQNLEYRLL